MTARCAKMLIKELPEMLNSSDTYGRTPLHIAAAKGNLNIVGFFIHKSACNFSAVDYRKRTPLHWAAANGKAICVKLLCEFGSKIDPQDEFGATPLHYAIKNNHINCVHILLKKGALVNSMDCNGRHPLIWAAIEGHLEAAKHLVGAHADVKHVDQASMTGRLAFDD